MERRTKPDPYAVEGGAEPERPPVTAPGGGVTGGGVTGGAVTSGAVAGKATAGGAQPESFTSDVRGNVHVIRFTSSDVLDAHEIKRLGDDLQAYLEVIDGPRAVIDLEPVRHLSSAALGMLVTVKTLVEGRGGAVCLANVRPEIRQIFTMTRLDKILRIYRTTKEAVDEI